MRTPGTRREPEAVSEIGASWLVPASVRADPWQPCKLARAQNGVTVGRDRHFAQIGSSNPR